MVMDYTHLTGKNAVFLGVRTARTERSTYNITFRIHSGYRFGWSTKSFKLWTTLYAPLPMGRSLGTLGQSRYFAGHIGWPSRFVYRITLQQALQQHHGGHRNKFHCYLSPPGWLATSKKPLFPMYFAWEYVLYVLSVVRTMLRSGCIPDTVPDDLKPLLSCAQPFTHPYLWAKV